MPICDICGEYSEEVYVNLEDNALKKCSDCYYGHNPSNFIFDDDDDDDDDD